MRKYTDQQILTLPDIRMSREARHEAIREQTKAQITKRKTFIQRVNELVHRYNQDAIEAEAEDIGG